MSAAPLTLFEDIMLLALRDEEGTVPLAASGYPYAIAAGILAELHFAGAIAVVSGEKHESVEARSNGDELEHPLLRDCLEEIRAATGDSIERWVIRFASMSKLKHRVAEGLCNRGILKVEDERVFLAFKRKIYPEIDPLPEKALIARLEAAIFEDTSEPCPRTAALVAIADSVELLSIPFSSQRLAKHRGHIHDLTRGDLFSDASRVAYEPIGTIVHAVQSNVVVFRN